MAESKNTNNYPDPNSPEGRSRAGRLYFALIVILFIFLGTVILVHQFGHNVIETKVVTIFKQVTGQAVEGTEPAAEGAEAASEESAEEGAAEPASEESATEEAPAEEPAAEEAPAEEGAH